MWVTPTGRDPGRAREVESLRPGLPEGAPGPGANRFISPLRRGPDEALPESARSIYGPGNPGPLSNIRARSDGVALAVNFSKPARAGNSAVRNLLCSSAAAALSGLSSSPLMRLRRDVSTHASTS